MTREIAEANEPIFVIGSLRSGASLLTLSLSQHPAITPVLETGWLERFGMGLQQAYAAGVRRRVTSQLDAAGIELGDFFAHFGEAANRLMCASLGESDRPPRWLDGTHDNTFQVAALLRLFPGAKFVHVLRDVREVVATLTSTENREFYKSQHILLSEQAAYQHWLEAVNACVAAERAFGSDTVLRVRRADLIAAPEATLCRCLRFLGEPFAPSCLRPFSSIEPVNRPETGVGQAGADRGPETAVRTEAELLSGMLLDEPTPSYARDEDRVFALEWAIGSRWERGESMVPQVSAGSKMWQRLRPSALALVERVRHFVSRS